MARGCGTIDVDLPHLTLRVKMPLLYGLRMWCMAACFRLAGLIGPVEVEIETVITADRGNG